jgi:hypothetical protein
MKQNLILLTVFLTALSASSAEYFVDASRPDDTGTATNWATAKKTIQAAVDLTVNGDTVWVTNGVYNQGGKKASGHSLTNRVCIEKAIYLRSVNGSEQTSIVGQGPLTNSAVRCVYLAPGAVLSGFTLTNGYTMGFNGSGSYDQYGGGVLLFNNSVVENCVLADNQARFGGGGAFCYEGGTLNNCTFLRNHADNNVYGYGGGVYVRNAGELNNCKFYGNSGRMGGGAALSGGVLNNCLIYKNGGIGVRMYGGTLNNCTVFGNSTDGVYFPQYGGGHLVNCIIWGNGSNIVKSDDFPVIEYTCTDPLQAGSGNISNAPLFATESADDYRLREGSLCIDSGTNLSAIITNDIDGNLRPLGAAFDMGAYEGGVPMYTITTIAGANGSITPENPVIVQGYGKVFSIQAAPGYRIDSITVDGNPVQTATSLTFTNVQSEHTISVIFVAIPYTLTVENGSGGGFYTTGAIVAVSADVGEDGYEFFKWTTDPPEYTGRVADASASTTTFSMPITNVTLTANYWSLSTNLYVDASRPNDLGGGTNWATAKKTIQSAVTIARTGATVFVTNGIYDVGGIVTPGYSLTSRVCITRAVTVKSINGAGVTVIKGEVGSNGGNDANSVRGVFMQNGSSLIGFTIAKGYTVHVGNNDFDRSGGGIWLATNCMVSDCILQENSASYRGGGVWFHSGGMLNNCMLNGNSAAYGGGAYLYFGGILNNCALSGNVANGYYGNGGGAYLGSGGILNNCTLSRNSTPGRYGDGGGVYLGSAGLLNNCIVWANTASSSAQEILNAGGTVRYTCSSSGVSHGAFGCITNNPLFVDGVNSNFHLQTGSPCINAGHNSYVSTTNDLDRNSRIVGGVADMGAYERQDAGLDFDADGMNDLWEMENFSSRYSANPNTVCSNGMNTILEAYIAGLDPNDPQSKFQTSVFCSPPSESVLRWNATSGRVYSVYFSTNLLNGFQSLETNITAGVYTDLVHSAGQGFYRIDVRKP